MLPPATWRPSVRAYWEGSLCRARSAGYASTQFWTSPSRHVSLLRPGLCLALLLACGGAAPARAIGLDTYVGAFGGQSNSVVPGCTTFSLPPGHTQLFGASSGVFVPVPGLATCSVAGQFDLQTAPTGPLADGTSLNTAFNSGANTLDGSSSASANYGRLASAASAAFGGASNGLIVKGAEAYGLFTDTLTFTSPSVAAGAFGTVLLTFSIDGLLTYSTAAPGTSGTGNVQLSWAKTGGGLGDAAGVTLNATVTSPVALPSVVVASGNSLAGITQAAGSVAIDADLKTVPIPFLFGSAFDLALGLQAWAQPGPDGTINASFGSTALLSAIEVFGPGGAPVTDFAIGAGSGSLYTATGVVPVPEPSVLALLLLAGLGFAARPGARRAASRSPCRGNACQVRSQPSAQ